MPKSRSLLAALAALFAIALVTSGCGGESKTTSPIDTTGLSAEDAAAKVAKEGLIAQIDGDGAKACAVLSERYLDEIYNDDCQERVEKAAKDQSYKFDKKSIKIGVVKVDGDKAVAPLTFKTKDVVSGKTVTLKAEFHLVNDDGVWQIDRFTDPKAVDVK